MDGLKRAADWLESGRPGERDLAAEQVRYGEMLWNLDGTRAYERQTEDVYELALVTGESALVYRVTGLEGACLR
ncbi:MAG TPA: hypothetical protein VFQ05_06665 [Candidatus Eisenbacteria bacterium]|nr:hypothetical protein [Candidatus Eisenbacteria bacterium]